MKQTTINVLKRCQCLFLNIISILYSNNGDFGLHPQIIRIRIVKTKNSALKSDTAHCMYVCTGRYTYMLYVCMCTCPTSTPQIRWRFFRNIILILIIGECAQKSLQNDYKMGVIFKQRHRHHIITFTVVYFNFCFRKKIFFHHTTIQS